MGKTDWYSHPYGRMTIPFKKVVLRTAVAQCFDQGTYDPRSKVYPEKKSPMDLKSATIAVDH